MEELAAVLGLTQQEFEIYRDYQANGAIDGERLLMVVRHESARRHAGGQPITGAMVASTTSQTRGS